MLGEDAQKDTAREEEGNRDKDNGVLVHLYRSGNLQKTGVSNKENFIFCSNYSLYGGLGPQLRSGCHRESVCH